MSVLIQAENLSKEFGALLAVDRLNLEVSEGEILALLGHNGAGKTTTVRMLASILKPTAGHATVAGLDVAFQGREVRRMVGHLTEMPGLYHRMSARAYLDFFGELYGMPQAHRRARADDLLREFDLADSADRRLGEYSKGMRQKVALIRAMLHAPRVLFLDEPTSALDPASAKQVRDVVAQLRCAGQTVVLCTHNLFEAEQLADRIAIIRRGKLLALGKAEELKRQFLGVPLFEVTLARGLGAPWSDLSGLIDVVASGDRFLRYRTTAPEAANPRLMQELADLGAQVVTLAPLPFSLEQVYLKLTQATGTLDLSGQVAGSSTAPELDLQ